ncbi:MAG: hypothetical protein Satyrvirus24_18 [Satyrvirus sp.]|uniref:RING-type domain-containing protein n=1 Tax=Satyrvirus sp. TaxID=2487771 RepID=A0A3G5AG72_9VIRU|nr:MAG: hypothetical protein Satyrvirus24_18 [Satyrvirus sp.]
MGMVLRGEMDCYFDEYTLKKLHASTYIKNISYGTLTNLIHNNQYQDALDRLGIISDNGNYNEPCQICHISHDTIIQLPCYHIACLETLLNFCNSHNYDIHNEKKCFDCQQPFNWSQCLAFSKSSPLNDRKEKRTRLCELI